MPRFFLKLVPLLVIILLTLLACSDSGNRRAEEIGEPKIIERAVDCPNTLRVDQISIDYPDAITIYREPMTSNEIIGDRALTRTVAILAKEDLSVSFQIEVYRGVEYEEVWEYIQEEPQRRLEVAESLEHEWGVPRSIAENTTYEDPERCVLNGSEAFICKWSLSAPGGVNHGLRYCILVDEDTIGVVTSSYTDEQYLQEAELFDTVFSSISVV